jgi:hypothetical protein
MSQELIAAWQAISRKWPEHTNDISQFIKSEKHLLSGYAEELQQCIT